MLGGDVQCVRGEQTIVFSAALGNGATLTHLRRQPIDQSRYCSILPSHGAHDLHAVAFVESACDRT